MISMAKKVKVSFSIDQETLQWIDEQVTSTKKFRNRSHVVEYAIEQLKRG
jgi:Arc/MetJ-type ribon-helix-helix transcriptional regulator